MTNATEELRTNLRALSDSFRMLKAGPGAWMMAEFVLREGVDCIAQPLPSNYARRPIKQCFANAARLVRRAKGLTYVEGFVASPRVPFPIHHGWAINAEREVVDPTLRDPGLCAYLGVPISREDYAQWVGNGSASVLLDHVGCVAVAFMTARCPALRELMA